MIAGHVEMEKVRAAELLVRALSSELESGALILGGPTRRELIELSLAEAQEISFKINFSKSNRRPADLLSLDVVLVSARRADSEVQGYKWDFEAIWSPLGGTVPVIGHYDTRSRKGTVRIKSV